MVMKLVKAKMKKPQVKQEPFGKYLERRKISMQQLQEMYAIYAQYYDNTNFPLFLDDFSNKHGAILIFHPKTEQIVGFSTMAIHQFEFGHQRYTFLFSGDTVVKREFWGNRALQATFVKLVMRLRFQYPRDEFYWLLISKGYKTYLLMANNYYVYYPNVEGKHQQLAPVLEYYCKKFFPKYYNEMSHLLNFGEDYQPLKGEVAPITAKMRLDNPKIDYFAKMNPTWEQGTELPCIGYLGWGDIMRYPLRFFSKPTSKGKQDAMSCRKQGVS